MQLDEPLQTMARTFSQICQGEEPWIALGNFMNDWFAYARDRREQLVQEPLFLAADIPLSLKRWAVFIAASVEWLCFRYDVPCPDWVYDSRLQLAEPWWYGVNADHPAVQARLMSTTPEPFTRRNIYCGDRMYNNKYELADLTARLKALRYARGKASSDMSRAR
ncbi:hypothetical protein EPA93_29350 [Ktedonosporobacter rubrisoli]|uniref:Uncharacterized protein n=2 Tax=Ktedonosporobacter rubrisoli TaxID=2509675 RepID=A0A4P6K669_KTERU|nr:hypothetical protein EPA93_29350 [Ktedonosporobacter rubrisoli]